MTDEMYKRLNNYLNDIFLELNKEDKIFIDNLIPIWRLNYMIHDFTLKNIKKASSKSYQNNLSFNDVYLLARNIINKINPNYLNEYDELINTGKLDFNYESREGISSCSAYYTNVMGDRVTYNKTIDIYRNFNYEDVVILIHEFSHYTQNKIGGKKSFQYEFLTEFIAIYFEKISIKYLQEENVPVKELNINSRIISLLRNNHSFYMYGTILLAYENLGDINENTINDLKNIINIKDDSFENECTIVLNKLDEISKLNNQKDSIKKMVNLVTIDYKYIVGTFLAYYALEHSKIEDMIDLNDNINGKYSQLSIEEILNKVGINIDEEMVNEALDIIKKSIYNYQEGKVK